MRWEPRGEPRLPPGARRPAGGGRRDRRGRTRRSGARIFLRQLDPGWPPAGAGGRARFAADGPAPRSRPTADRSTTCWPRSAPGGATTPTGGAGARSASSTTRPTTSSSGCSERWPSEYLHENYLNPFAFPSLLQMEQEVVAMAADLFGSPTAPASSPPAAPRASSSPCRWPASTPARRAASPSRSSSRPPPPTPPSPRPPTTSTSSTCSCRWATTAGSTRGRGRRRAHRPHRAPRRLGAVLPVRRHRPDPRAGRRWPPSGSPLPRRRLPRRLAAAVLGAARRARPAVGPLGARASPRSRPTSTSTAGRFKGVSVLLHRDAGACCGTSTSSTTRGPAGSTARPPRPAPARARRSRRPGPRSTTSASDGYLRLAAQVRDATARLPRRASRPSTGLRITGDPVMGVMEIALRRRTTSRAVNDVMDDRGWHLDRQQGGPAPDALAVPPRGRRRSSSPTWPTRWPTTAPAGASRPRYGGVAE